MSSRKHKEILEAIDKELEGTGIAYILEPTSKHLKVRLNYGEKTRLVVMSSTASDYRAIKNKIRDVRHAVHSLKEMES